MSSRVLLPARAVAPPALDPGVCHVWWVRPEDVGPGHDALLAPADLQRRERLRRPADRHRLTAAAAVLRLVLGAYAGVAPDRVHIDRTCPGCGEQHGKPRTPDLPGVHFSVSHCAGAVAVAVGADGPVGVDVEEVGRYEPAELDRLADDVLAAEERAELARLPSRDRAVGFTTYWTRKEALVKATGDGLGVRLDGVVVSPPSTPPQLLRWDGRSVTVALRALHPPAGVVGTLAVLGRPAVAVVEHHAGPLLRTA
jgi:4'-phosphopantetheinyl transferase